MNKDEAKAAHDVAVFEAEDLLAELERLTQLYDAEAKWEHDLWSKRRSSRELRGRRTSVANYHLGQYHAYRAAAFALRRTLAGQSSALPRVESTAVPAQGRKVVNVPASRRVFREELEAAASKNGWLVNETLPGADYWDVIRTDTFRRGQHTLDVSYRCISGQGYLGDVSSAYYDGQPVDSKDRPKEVLRLLRQIRE